jgi:hypothetical protein
MSSYMRSLKGLGFRPAVVALISIGVPTAILYGHSQPTYNEPEQKRAVSVRQQIILMDSIKKNNYADNLVLISGTSHKELTYEISSLIKVPVANVDVGRFADGEVNIQMHDHVRSKNVYIIQPCAAPVNDSIMELLLMISCARRAGAKNITAVIPYFGYKHHRRGSVISTNNHSRFLSSGAMDFAKMLKEMGVDRVVAVDLQRPGQGHEACFFDTKISLEVRRRKLGIMHVLKLQSTYSLTLTPSSD